MCARQYTQPLPCLLCVAVKPPWIRLELQLQGARQEPTAYGLGTTLYFHLWLDNSIYISQVQSGSEMTRICNITVSELIQFYGSALALWSTLVWTVQARTHHRGWGNLRKMMQIWKPVFLLLICRGRLYWLQNLIYELINWSLLWSYFIGLLWSQTLISSLLQYSMMPI